MLVVNRIPVSVYNNWAVPLMFLSLFLLLLVIAPGIAKSINGSSRWIRLGFFNFQVSELVKMTFILYLASYLTRRADEVASSLSGFIKPMALLALFAALLLAEPDMGSTVVLAIITLGMLFIGMIPIRYITILSALVGSACYILVIFAPYRIARVLSFIDPWTYSLHQGYQLTQSLMAIGRGGFWGQGLSFSIEKLYYLPEAHTDFIFSILIEELGWMGGLLLLTLYVWMGMRIWQLAKKSFLSDKPFHGYIVTGIFILLVSQVFINMGVCLGILPTKGMTLPLISYGGSSLLMNMFSIALCHRISKEVHA